MSLDAIALSTKVSARHLQALEGCSWGDLPGGVFTRGMVRSYCRCIGLNESEWLGRLAASSPLASSTAEDWVEFAENVKRARQTAQPGMRRRWWGVLVLGAALAGLSWAAWRYVLQPRVGLKAVPSLHALLFPAKR